MGSPVGDYDESAEAKFVRAEQELKAAQKRADRVGGACIVGASLGFYLLVAPFVSSWVIEGEAWLRARSTLEQRDNVLFSAKELSSLRTRLQQSHYDKLYHVFDNLPRRERDVLATKIAQFHIDDKHVRDSLERIAVTYQEAAAICEADSCIVYYKEARKEANNLRRKYTDIGLGLVGLFGSLSCFLPRRFERKCQERYNCAQVSLDRARVE